LSSTRDIIDRRDRHMTINYGRYPIAIDRGEGSELFDCDGKRYLDLFAGFGASILGHCHPDLVEAVTAQANRLWHPGNLLHSEPQTLLAERIAKHGFGGRSFFCHSGADANEAAFKLARLHGRANPGASGPRYKIISAHRSFHGRLFASMVATGQAKVREGFDPFVSGFLQVDYNDIDAIKAALDDQTAAIIVEPIQGEGGIVVPHDDYLPRLRKLCDERDLLLICDEVWTGGGRTGRYFAHQHWNITPDVMTLAKGVGGGLPVGVMCATDKAAQLFDYRVHGAVAHATTLGGNCLSMAVAARLFDVLERDNLVQRAADLGDETMQRLRHFAASNPTIKQVRGKGLFIGIELDKSATDIVNACQARGVLINGTQNTVIRLAPALTINEAQLDEGLSVLEQTIAG
jgi:acetylornithine aminotransferase